MKYQIGEASSIDEYVPQMTPTISGSANSLIEDTPNMNSDSTMKNVVSDVNRLRESVSDILLSATVISSSLSVLFARFSLIRSNTTIVSLIE